MDGVLTSGFCEITLFKYFIKKKKSEGYTSQKPFHKCGLLAHEFKVHSDIKYRVLNTFHPSGSSSLFGGVILL